MVVANFTNCGVDINTVLQHQRGKLAGVGNLPHRIPVGLKDQLITDGIQGDAPVLTVGVIGMTKRAEEIGVVAMSIAILVAD